jgi:hypothetical protein
MTTHDNIHDFIDDLIADKQDHPLKYLPYRIKNFFNKVFDETKWGFQRMFRGWDDRVIWSIDYHIAEMLPVWIEELVNRHDGIPLEFIDEVVEDFDITKTISEKESNQADQLYITKMEEIIQGFNSYKKIADYEYESQEEFEYLYEQYEHGMDLLKKYFNTLWW